MPSPIPYTYTPFSSGSRKCIGKNLAIMEVKIVLSNLIRLFKINGHPDTDYNVTATLSLKPKSEKILLQFQNRNIRYFTRNFGWEYFPPNYFIYLGL